MPTVEPLVSPRIAALQQALEAGNHAALDAFWRQVAAEGAPLIEPLAGEARQMLVTFVWRGDANLKNVVVMGDLGGFDPQRNQLTHLPQSDLWYKSYRTRDDTRTTYQFSPNDSLVSLEGDPNWQARIANFVADPLNPRTFVYPRDPETPEDQDQIDSVLELPAAPPQPWSQVHPEVPAGSIQLHRLRSARLDNERRVWVYTPPSYTTAGEPYGLLLIFDGLDYLHLIPAPTILDNLTAAGRIPPLVAILPDSLGPATRSRELPCHPPFAEYLAHDLIPWAREHYHVTTDPARTVVAGASFGGLAAVYAGLRHPEVFGHVLSQSGSFWWRPDGDAEHEWHTRQFVLQPRLPLTFYLDVGSLEIAPGNGGPSQVIANRHLRDVLQAKGYPVAYAEFSGGHNHICRRGTLADGLLALIGRTAPEPPKTQ